MRDMAGRAMSALAWGGGRELLRRFRRDQSGSYLIIAGLLMPVLAGFVGFGTDTTLWYYKHRTMQDAADGAAISAATAFNNGVNDVTGQANAVASAYGFVNGTNSVTVTVNQPPLSGPNTANSGAVEVIVRQPQRRLFSALFGSEQAAVSGRAVAAATAGTGCVLALDQTKKGIAIYIDIGTLPILSGCSLFDNSNNIAALTVGVAVTLTALSVRVVGGISGLAGITTTPVLGNITTGDAPIADPYANTFFPAPPAGCDQTNYTSTNPVTLSPGTYCGGMAFHGSANVTLNPGIYYLEGGSLTVDAGVTLTGTGVTLVFTSQTPPGGSYATATINVGATVNLTAPTTGPTKGIVFFGDRNMPNGTQFTLNGGLSQVFDGALYLPEAYVRINGAASITDLKACIQLVADSIEFTGNVYFAVNCTGKGTKSIGSKTAKLVE